MKRFVNSAEDIFGMSRVGYSGEFEIYVNTNDGGSIPHFHMRDKTDWDRFHTCISIVEPRYFIHEGKEGVLNSKQKRELQKFMTSKVSLSKYSDKFDNNWQLVCFLWDLNNSTVNIPETVKQPNYMELR